MSSTPASESFTDPVCAMQVAPESTAGSAEFRGTKFRQNLFFAFIYNAAGIPIAAGLLYPFAAMSLSSVSVIANALRLRRLRLH